MTTPHLDVDLRGTSADVGIEVASALFGMAAAQTGATVSDLQRGDIALADLIETLDLQAPLEGIRLDSSVGGFSMTLRYSTSLGPLPHGADQIVDAGFDDWQLNDSHVVISLATTLSDSDRD